MPGDASAVEGISLSRPTLRRIWTFARPYRRLLAVYLVGILAAALLAIVPPLIVRAIIDTAIPDADRTHDHAGSPCSASPRRSPTPGSTCCNGCAVRTSASR